MKASKELRGRALSQDEIDSLMRVCFSDRTPAEFRDAALIAILRGAGLRWAEVVKLDLKDFNNDNNDGEIKIRSGKGRVDRTVYLSPGVQSLAGHSNPAITARYDRRGEERKRIAAAQLEILGR